MFNTDVGPPSDDLRDLLPFPFSSGSQGSEPLCVTGKSSSKVLPPSSHHLLYRLLPLLQPVSFLVYSSLISRTKQGTLEASHDDYPISTLSVGATYSSIQEQNCSPELRRFERLITTP